MMEDSEIINDAQIFIVDEDENNPKQICFDCGGLVPNKSLKKHKKRDHTYKCQQCQISFKFEELLNQHMELHLEKKYPCQQCDLSFAKIVDLALHIQIHSNPSLKFKCPICDFETPLKYSLINHVKLHAEEEFKYECEICKKKYLGRIPFEDHVALHEGVEKYSCEFCPKKFIIRRYWAVHRKLNHKKELFGAEEEFKCDVCSRIFKFANSLVRHQRTVHKIGKDISRQCPECPKVLSNGYYLRLHMRVHTGERPYVCHICGKGFIYNFKLKRHLLIHKEANDEELLL